MKHCACGKQLYSTNKSGVCSKCWGESKDLRREYHRKWREANPSILTLDRQYRKAYRDRNPDRCLEKYYQQSRDPRQRFNKAKNSAMRRGYAFLITWEEYQELLGKPCDYCGRGLEGETGVGLDRLDNSGDYLTSNVVPCCGTCNGMRGTRLTPEEMHVVVRALLDFRKGA